MVQKGTRTVTCKCPSIYIRMEYIMTCTMDHYQVIPRHLAEELYGFCPNPTARSYLPMHLQSVLHSMICGR